MVAHIVNFIIQITFCSMTPFERQIQRNNQHQRPYPKNGQFYVGFLLILAASFTLVLGIVSVSLPTLYYGYYGNSLWTGAVIMIGGILSVRSSNYDDNKCAALGGLVMNILSIIFTCVHIHFMKNAALLEEYYNDQCNKYSNNNDYYYNRDPDCVNERAIDIALVVLGVIELGLTIAAVCVLSVDVCCCSTTQHQLQAMQVRYHAGQPVEIQSGCSQVVGPAGEYPTTLVQYPTGQPQQYPAYHPQHYPAGQPSRGAPENQ